MKRFYCVILAMLAVILYAIVMSGCRAISSNVEVATQPVVETPLAEHIGKMRQGSFINDAEEFVRNISVLLEEKSPHDYSVRRIEEIPTKRNDILCIFFSSFLLAASRLSATCILAADKLSID